MWRAWVVLAVGCNQVYGLDQTKPRDSLVLEDFDGDGKIDLDDNCPMIANEDQRDLDGDLRGDVCDDCPLITNAPGGDADGDQIGDICDPHPRAKDCLVFIDTFKDPAVFATNWQVEKEDPMSVVDVQPGRLEVTPKTGNVFVQAVGITGRADMIVTGTTINDAGVVRIVSNRANETHGCSLNPPSSFDVLGTVIGPAVLSQLVPTDAIGNAFSIRLIMNDSEDAAGLVDVTCRIDYGVSAGTGVKRNNDPLVGPSGFEIGAGPARINAVALFQQRATCPPTSYR